MKKQDYKLEIYKLLDFTDRKGEDIADPWYTGNFDETYDDVLEGSCSADTYVSLAGSNGCVDRLTNWDGTQKVGLGASTKRKTQKR